MLPNMIYSVKIIQSYALSFDPIRIQYILNCFKDITHTPRIFDRYSFRLRQSVMNRKDTWQLQNSKCKRMPGSLPFIQRTFQCIDRDRSYLHNRVVVETYIIF